MTRVRPATTARAVLLFAYLAASLAGRAVAGEFWTTEPRRGGEGDRRRELIDAGHQYAARAMDYWHQGAELQRSDRREARLRFAIARKWASRAVTTYDSALELGPDDADLHFRLGVLLYEHFWSYYSDEVPMRAKRDEVGRQIVAHWDAFDRLAPRDARRLDFVREAGPRPLLPVFQFVPLTYQFSRALIHSRLGAPDAYARALVDYDYLLSVTPRNDLTAPWIAQVLTNSAEVLMALGRLDEAIERYKEGVEIENRALYLYGLAVAMDRAGFGETALQLMRDGAVIDRFNALGELTSDTVFFIPEGDLFFDHALGLEALGQTDEARSNYQRFLDIAADSPYRERAREHLRDLGVKPGTDDRPRGPRWRRDGRRSD
jgi:tetratricopeptide (TPR) repeat protein